MPNCKTPNDAVLCYINTDMHKFVQHEWREYTNTSERPPTGLDEWLFKRLLAMSRRFDTKHAAVRHCQKYPTTRSKHKSAGGPVCRWHKNEKKCDEEVMSKVGIIGTSMLIQGRPDEYALEGMQINLPKEAHTDRSSVTSFETTVDLTNKVDASKIGKPPWTPPDGPNAMSIQWNEGPYDVRLSFCKVTYRLRISISTSSSAICTLESIVN